MNFISKGFLYDSALVRLAHNEKAAVQEQLDCGVIHRNIIIQLRQAVCPGGVTQQSQPLFAKASAAVFGVDDHITQGNPADSIVMIGCFPNKVPIFFC